MPVSELLDLTLSDLRRLCRVGASDKAVDIQGTEIRVD